MNIKRPAGVVVLLFLFLLTVAGRAGASFTGASGVNVSADVGTAFNGAVATYTDSNPAETAASYSATIDWGDGTPASADSAITGPSPFTVFGVHTYTKAGTFTVTVTITEDTSLASISAIATAKVSGLTSETGTSFSAMVGAPFNGAVATFTDSDSTEGAAAFAATIDWGDGSPASADSAITGPSPFTVFGVHTYTKAGSFTVTVTITETASLASISATATAQVSGLTSATGDSFSVVQGMPFNGAVATFTDSDSTETAASYSATIDWGDGTPATADSAITGPSPFTVFGVHTYAHEGSFTVTVTITEDTSLASISATSTATVSDVLTGSPLVFTAFAKIPFTGEVATFTETEATNTAADFVAVIHWGGWQHEPRHGRGRRRRLHGLRQPHLRQLRELPGRRHAHRERTRHRDGDRHQHRECGGLDRHHPGVELHRPARPRAHPGGRRVLSPAERLTGAFPRRLPQASLRGCLERASPARRFIAGRGGRLSRHSLSRTRSRPAGAPF
jgi:hypothetical protein